MKLKRSIILSILGMMLFMPSIVLSKSQQDSLVLGKVFSYRRNYAESIEGATCNIYMKYGFNTIKRNPTLFLIPTMYTIAKGSHNYLGETYGQIQFKDIEHYDIKRQIAIGNIPHHRKTMPIMFTYTIPNIYGISLFGGRILSPFNEANRQFYKYQIHDIDETSTEISFCSRVRNTQLVSGDAIVNNRTGGIIRASFNGEYDMIKFATSIEMNVGSKANMLVPKSSETTARFKFMGNHIEARFQVNYDCPPMTIHEDAVNGKSDLEMMAEIRPDSLNGFEKSIYNDHYIRKDSISGNPRKGLSAKRNRFTEIAWDVIGDHMINSTSAETSNMSFRLSPLLNPLYLSYSHSRGLSYKMKINARYDFAYNKNISLNPSAGYNFKIKKMYINAPLRYTYNSKHNRWVELLWSNGNRITNSSVLDIIKDERRDTLDFSSLSLDYFDDNMLKLSASTDIGKKLSLMLACTYHVRKAVNRDDMIEMGKPTSYRSFAPQISLAFRPYVKGPVFTANYERSLPDILRSNMEYERYEFDVSFNKQLRRLRQYNLRAGCGFYTNQTTTYFVDFSNFRENYLPDDTDDWTGQFQMLNSQWYNASKYYVRTNISYESPLLFLTWIPLVGKYIETERLYLSTLQIEHTRPYLELGYSLTNRYFSVGVFGSLLNGGIHEIGSKFTLELFRRW